MRTTRSLVIKRRHQQRRRGHLRQRWPPLVAAAAAVLRRAAIKGSGQQRAASLCWCCCYCLVDQPTVGLNRIRNQSINQWCKRMQAWVPVYSYLYLINVTSNYKKLVLSTYKLRSISNSGKFSCIVKNNFLIRPKSIEKKKNGGRPCRHPDGSGQQPDGSIQGDCFMTASERHSDGSWLFLAAFNMTKQN